MRTEIKRVLEALSNGGRLVHRLDGMAYLDPKAGPLTLLDRHTVSQLKGEGWVRRCPDQPNPFVRLYELREVRTNAPHAG